MIIPMLQMVNGGTYICILIYVKWHGYCDYIIYSLAYIDLSTVSVTASLELPKPTNIQLWQNINFQMQDIFIVYVLMITIR